MVKNYYFECIKITVCIVCSVPLSCRPYLQHAGLRATIASIMVSLANILVCTLRFLFPRITSAVAFGFELPLTTKYRNNSRRSLV
jgi:hypothetical protein